MAKQVSYPLQSNISYTANTTKRVELPTSGYITHIDMILKLTATTSSTTVKEDAYHRLLKSLRIKAAGAKTFIEFSDGRQLKFYSVPQYKFLAQEDLIAGTASGGVYRCHMPLHLGFDPFDVYDQSVVIPAVRLQDLVLEVTWGADTDIGASGVTAVSAQLDFVIHEISLAPGETEASIWQNGIVSPRFEPKTYSSVAGSSNLGWTHDLPVGDTLYRMVLMQLDTDVRTDDVETTGDFNTFGIKFPKLRETTLEFPWFHLKHMNKLQYELPSLNSGPVSSTAVKEPVGVAWIDGKMLNGRPAGLDLSRAVTGDVQLCASVGSGTPSLQILHVMYQ